MRSGGVAIAYQVVGEGERDLVFVSDYCSNLVYGWESRYWRPFYERLAESFRLILFDKRGTGLSDRGGSFPTLETRMEDVRAVMGAVGSERALIFGSHEGCLMATLFAATYPEETAALALFHPPLLSIAGADHPDEATLRDTPRALGHAGALRRDTGAGLPDARGERGGQALVRELAAGRRKPGDGL